MAPIIPVLVVLLVLPAVGADAHHGWSGYDQNQEPKLSGTIQESGYEHPHGHVRLEAPGKTWLVTLAPSSPPDGSSHICDD